MDIPFNPFQYYISIHSSILLQTARIRIENNGSSTPNTRDITMILPSIFLSFISIDFKHFGFGVSFSLCANSNCCFPFCQVYSLFLSRSHPLHHLLPILIVILSYCGCCCCSFPLYCCFMNRNFIFISHCFPFLVCFIVFLLLLLVLFLFLFLFFLFFLYFAANDVSESSNCMMIRFI